MAGQGRVARMSHFDVLRTMGRHLRWLRDAYEEIQPGRHNQGQWAAMLGVNASQLSRWENGTQVPHLDQLCSIVLSTRCSFDYLIFGVVSLSMHSDVREVLLRDHGLELREPESWARVLAQSQTAGPLAQTVAELGGGPRPRGLQPRKRQRRRNDNNRLTS
jgi:transcriptional regulator with XRE-family HTH domain